MLGAGHRSVCRGFGIDGTGAGQARRGHVDLDGDRLAVRLELGDGRQAIQLFDARTGAALGTIALQ